MEPTVYINIIILSIRGGPDTVVSTLFANVSLSPHDNCAAAYR